VPIDRFPIQRSADRIPEKIRQPFVLRIIGDGMNKLNTFFSGLVILLGTLFLMLIVYVSILGDNDKIDFLVTSLFNDIKTRNFTAACTDLGTSSRTDLKENPEACMNFCFLLELSLLKKFDLLQNKDYSVVIKRDHFWIPYLTADQVWVGIALSERKKNMFQQMISHFGKDDFVTGAIRVDRRNNHWEIAEIKVEGTSLEPVFTGIKTSLDLNRYLEKTESGFKIRENTIDMKAMTPEERRLLEFSLFRLGTSK
jgi:hypothetical protein